MNHRHRTLPVLFAILILFVLAGVLWRGYSQRAISISAALPEKEAYWTQRIQAEGGKGAYGEFTRYAHVFTSEVQHQEAHIFGDALFDVEGLSGLSACDSRFSFGCFHAFIGRAIATLGLSVVRELDANCFRTLGPGLGISCQHGIGHGVLAGVGYDDAALRKALSVCKALPSDDPVGGCYGGVFMEYNMRTMIEGGARADAAHDLQYPCDAVDVEFRQTCYFYQPQWWLNLQHVTTGKDHVDFAAAGTLCDAAPTEPLIRSCYEGLGVMAPSEVDFEPAQSARLCEQSSLDSVRRLYCTSYAANAFFDPASKRDGMMVCEGLSGAYHTYCTEYATNRASLAKQLPSFIKNEPDAI
jgi:hypothetical protein